MSKPHIVLFDVNETLSNTEPLSATFKEIGAPELAAKLWFAQLLRDGLALTTAGTPRTFADLATGSLRNLLPQWLTGGVDHAVEQVMNTLSELQPHPDVTEGVRQLRAAGMRLVTLSNGSPDIADKLLTKAGVREEFDELLSVQDIGGWKPAAAAYRHAAQTCDADLDAMILVAVHAWDIHGAATAGMHTAWINRDGVDYPTYFEPAEYAARSLPELAQHLS